MACAAKEVLEVKVEDSVGVALSEESREVLEDVAAAADSADVKVELAHLKVVSDHVDTLAWAVLEEENDAHSGRDDLAEVNGVVEDLEVVVVVSDHAVVLMAIEEAEQGDIRLEIENAHLAIANIAVLHESRGIGIGDESP